MTPQELTFLEPGAHDEPFPPAEMAWDEPNGLIAIGGDLSVPRLINAYRSGIFPWFNPGEPIYWWNPDPRAVLLPEMVNFSRSLRKTIRNKGYKVVFDHNFKQVIAACAAPRSYSSGTWISPEMQQAYCRLHDAGVAHSVEVYNKDDVLVGGLYGISSGGVFCGESMFSTEPNTSKIAFIALAWYAQHVGYTLIDCQLENSHLLSLGSTSISRKDYMTVLRSAPEPEQADWVFDQSVDLSRWEPGQTD